MTKLPHGPAGALALATAFLSAAGAGTAQEVPLGSPTATLTEGYSVIQSVRELSDGRVMIADPLGQALVVVDPGLRSADTIGRVGQGPREYRQPDAVWPLPGDSTLLVDLGNGRLTTIDPDGDFVATMPIAQGEPGPGRPLVIALPQAVDGRGRIYFRSLGGPGGGADPFPDSSAVLRLDRGSGAVDTVAVVKTPDVETTTSGSANDRSVSAQQVPLSPADAWGVAADGSLVVARAGDYHVEWLRPDGSVVAGPPVDYRPVRIGRAEREEWDRNRFRAGGGLSIGMSVENGNRTMTMSRGGGGDDDSNLDRLPWPDVKPPFYGGGVEVDPRGRAWVRRHMDAGEPPTYDVFDGRGRRVGTVVLEGDRTVIGFGADAVYVVAYDEFDLQYLEKYAMPSL